MSESQVRLISKIPNVSIPEAPLLIPTSFKRDALVQLVLHLIGAEGSLQTFNFVINGKVLSGSIESFMRTNSLSMENILDIHVISGQRTPTILDSADHPDWISSVQWHNDGRLVSSGYNGNISVYKLDAESKLDCLLEFRAADDPIKVARWNGSEIVTGGLDGILRVHDEAGDCILKGNFHRASILDVSVMSGFAVSGAHDGTLKLWNLKNSKINGEADSKPKEKKKRKKELNVASLADPVGLEGHSGPVTGVILCNEDVFSVSGDNTLRIWDAEVSKCSQILVVIN